MSYFGYKKGLSVTIHRTKHRVGFQNGCSVRHLIELLTKVPLEATVDEVFCDSGENSVAPDITIIHFHEESRSEVPA
jgi:hypothetical protein